jgi:KEOPS complex subunit Pcc1
MVRHTAVFSCRSGLAPEIYRALTPEAGGINPRTGVTVSLEGDDLLVISVGADDLPALRAALNMWLRLVSVASEMLEMTGAGRKDGVEVPREPGSP